MEIYVILETTVCSSWLGFIWIDFINYGYLML